MAVGVMKSSAGLLSASCWLLLPFLQLMAAKTLDAKKLDQSMKLHFLRNVSVTCNDGSPAG